MSYEAGLFLATACGFLAGTWAGALLIAASATRVDRKRAAAGVMYLDETGYRIIPLEAPHDRLS